MRVREGGAAGERLRGGLFVWRMGDRGGEGTAGWDRWVWRRVKGGWCFLFCVLGEGGGEG